MANLFQMSVRNACVLALLINQTSPCRTLTRLFGAPPCATHNEMSISNQLSLIKVTTQTKLFASLLLRVHFIRSLSIVIE